MVAEFYELLLGNFPEYAEILEEKGNTKVLGKFYVS